MVSEADNKFTWVIKDFSSLQSKRIYSDGFLIGGYKWCLTAYPKGSKVDCLSLYLGVADHESLPLGWRRHTKFSLKVVNQFSEKSSIQRDEFMFLDFIEATEWYSQKNPSFGFTKIIPLAKLHSKDGGFLVNDELKIVAEVDVLQEADDASEGSQETTQPMKKKTKTTDCGTGSSDSHNNKEPRVGNETVDVNGFQVSISQVACVRCIFEKHPDFASKVRSNNQHLKSTYMNVLLELIETLCQVPEKLSDDDLGEASAAVLYLTQVGFKVDWLEKKLEEVKEKKTRVNTGKAEVQRMKEELRNLTKKCSDMKDLVKKQNVALSFSDVV